MGPPGVGKGTQSKRLAEVFGFPHVSSGDLLREHLRIRTRIGCEAKDFMERGALVPDSLIGSIVIDRIASASCKTGFILDGFPRTCQQADALHSYLSELSADKTKTVCVSAVHLFVDHALLFRRLASRRVCPTCYSVYNINDRPPRVKGLCDLDSTALVTREDDRNEIVIWERIKLYEEQTLPILNYYSEKRILAEVNANYPADEVTPAILAAVRRCPQM